MVLKFVEDVPDRNYAANGQKADPESGGDSLFEILQDLLVKQAGLKKYRRVYEDGRRVQYSDSVYLSIPRYELVSTTAGSVVTYRVAIRNAHVQRRVYGTRDESVMDKFMRRVEKRGDGHWYWIGHIDSQGYGRFGIKEEGKNKTVGAHRWIYEQMIRPLEEGEVVDHRNDICGIRSCVNYQDGHLDAVTIAENSRRGRVKLSLRNFKVCGNGHVLAEVGTRVDERGTVLCLGCGLDKVQRCAKGYFDRRVEICAQEGLLGVFCTHGHNLELLNSLDSRGNCRECNRLAEQARRDRLKGL